MIVVDVCKVEEPVKADLICSKDTMDRWGEMFENVVPESRASIVDAALTAFMDKVENGELTINIVHRKAIPIPEPVSVPEPEPTVPEPVAEAPASEPEKSSVPEEPPFPSFLSRAEETPAEAPVFIHKPAPAEVPAPEPVVPPTTPEAPVEPTAPVRPEPAFTEPSPAPVSEVSAPEVPAEDVDKMIGNINKEFGQATPVEEPVAQKPAPKNTEDLSTEDIFARLDALLASGIVPENDADKLRSNHELREDMLKRVRADIMYFGDPLDDAIRASLTDAGFSVQ